MHYIRIVVYSILKWISIVPLSYVVPLKKDVWVFGSYHDKFIDNTKFFYLWVHRNKPDKKIVWITGSKDVIAHLQSVGMPVVRRNSWRAIWLLLRAEKVFCSSYSRDVGGWGVRHSKLVNLWHGVGFKDIQFTIKNGPLYDLFHGWKSYIYRIVLPWHYQRPSIFLATSTNTARDFKESFRLSDSNIIINNYPRLDENALSIAREIDDYTDIVKRLSSFNKNIIYMPTWRDTHTDFLRDALPDISALNAVLKKQNTHLYIKVHTNTPILDTFDTTFRHSNITFWDNAIDIYPVLSKFDVCLSDYSTIVYDFLYIQKKVCLYTFDEQAYMQNNRGMSDTYYAYKSGCTIDTFSALVESIATGDIFKDSDTTLTQKTREYFWHDDSNTACEELFNTITNHSTKV